LETKIEYQLSLEMAEELAIEQVNTVSPNSSHRQWLAPIFFGIFLALLFGSGSYTWKTESHDYSGIIKESWTVIGFCIGFGYGWASIIESGKRIRKNARVMQQKSGSPQTIVLDNEWLTISSNISRVQMKWDAIDKLVNGKIGIHFLVGEKIFFVIHKKGLPQEISRRI
jgi:hypothetical protein